MGLVMSGSKPELAVHKARVLATEPSRYILGAGGRSPKAPEPFTLKDGYEGCDCIGFVCWLLAIDRFQPYVEAGTIREYGGWINCDSAIGDSHSAQAVFERVSKPAVGDIVIYPSKAPFRRHGHVGLITRVNGDTSDWTDHLWSRPSSERKKFLAKLEVIDCAAALSRRLRGKAIAVTTAAASWNKPDAMFLRYKHWSA